MANYNVRFSIRLNTGNIEANDWLFKNGETTAPEESLKRIAGTCISQFLKEHKLGELSQVSDLINSVELFIEQENGKQCVRKWDSQEFKQ